MAAVETVADWDQQREEVVEAVLLYEAADDSTPTSPWAGQEDGGRFVAEVELAPALRDLHESCQQWAETGEGAAKRAGGFRGAIS